jgi:hypothetical protein
LVSAAGRAHRAATIALTAHEPQDERYRTWLLYDFGQATAFTMLAAADPGTALPT